MTRKASIEAWRFKQLVARKDRRRRETSTKALEAAKAGKRPSEHTLALLYAIHTNQVVHVPRGYSIAYPKFLVGTRDVTSSVRTAQRNGWLTWHQYPKLEISDAGWGYLTARFA